MRWFRGCIFLHVVVAVNLRPVQHNAQERSNSQQSDVLDKFTCQARAPRQACLFSTKTGGTYGGTQRLVIGRRRVLKAQCATKAKGASGNVTAVYRGPSSNREWHAEARTYASSSASRFSEAKRGRQQMASSYVSYEDKTGRKGHLDHIGVLETREKAMSDKALKHYTASKS